MSTDLHSLDAALALQPLGEPLALTVNPRVFRRRQRFTPAGTVSITTCFCADAAALAAQGFFDQSAELWGDDGHLLASSHQIVYDKE